MSNLPYQNYGSPSGQSNFGGAGGIKSGVNIFGGASDQSNPFGSNAATSQGVNAATSAIGNATAALTGTGPAASAAGTGTVTNSQVGTLANDVLNMGSPGATTTATPPPPVAAPYAYVDPQGPASGFVSTPQNPGDLSSNLTPQETAIRQANWNIFTQPYGGMAGYIAHQNNQALNESRQGNIDRWNSHLYDQSVATNTPSSPAWTYSGLDMQGYGPFQDAAVSNRQYAAP